MSTVDQVLNTFHRAAAHADFTTYFACFASNGVFIGTDASERWTVQDFRVYAAPGFANKQGWVYRPQRRHVSYASNNKNVAWFDEILASERFGVARGTGVLVQDEDDNWKIAQYHLTVPVPNHLMDRTVQTIRDQPAPPRE